MRNKIDIITTVSAWPQALEAQRHLLNKYSKDSFNFIGVIDTSPTPNPWNLWDSKLRGNAEKIAQEFCDEVIMMPEELHFNRREIFPSTKVSKAKFSNERAADVLQFIFEKKILNSTIPSLILDSDMFPISTFSVIQLLDSNSIRGVIQKRKGRFSREVKYYWNGILMFDPPNLHYLADFSFDCGKVRGLKVDTGGQSHWWIKKIEENGFEATLGYISHLSSLNWRINDYEAFIPEGIRKFILNDDRNQAEKMYSEIYDQSFLHFRAGSNWREESAQVVKERNRRFLKSCMQ
jgi:hypothetical protein